MGQLVTAGRLLGGVKTGPQKILTDSRFPGTTELLSTASVELKGVRANLEEQVRKRFQTRNWSWSPPLFFSPVSNINFREHRPARKYTGGVPGAGRARTRCVWGAPPPRRGLCWGAREREREQIEHKRPFPSKKPFGSAVETRNTETLSHPHSNDGLL